MLDVIELGRFYVEEHPRRRNRGSAATISCSFVDQVLGDQERRA
jgi:hypothetical protein